jgi:hypothetical protein
LTSSPLNDYVAMRMAHGEQRLHQRRLLQLLACCLVAILAACGGSGSGTGDKAVVRVNGDPITQAQVEHWMSVVAASASTDPGEPKFKTPKPPSYTACIAYLRRYPSFGAGAEPVEPTPAALKAKCELERRKEQLKALYTLIAFDWVSGEATELGVRLAPEQQSKLLALFERRSFPSGESFGQYLASMGQTRSDVMMQLEQELLVAGVHRKLEAQASARGLTTTAQRQLALTRFAVGYEREWRQRTDCQAGYVVPICRQYVAPSTPSALVPNAVPLTDLAPE